MAQNWTPAAVMRGGTLSGTLTPLLAARQRLITKRRDKYIISIGSNTKAEYEKCLGTSNSNVGPGKTTEFTWKAIKWLGLKSECIKINSDDPIPANATQIHRTIYAINELRFAFAYLYKRELHRFDPHMTAEFTGSSNHDSDIDISVNLSAIPSDNVINPIRIMNMLLRELFPNLDPKHDANTIFDINIYVTNFDINLAVCDTINSSKNRNLSFTKMETRKWMINQPEYPMHFAYFRVRHMFAETSEIFTTLENLDKERIAKKLDSYEEATTHMYKTVCSSTDVIDVHKAIFYAMFLARDQYFTRAAYSLVVLGADVADFDDHVLAEAAWDNFGMLYHVLQSEICDEPNWIAKVAKYIIRICAWIRDDNAIAIIRDLVPKLRDIKDSNQNENTFGAFVDAMNAFDTKTDRDLLFTKPLENLNKSLDNNGNRRVVLEICFKFMMRFFNVDLGYHINQQNAGRRLTITNFQKTSERITIGKRQAVVYIGKRGAKYVRLANQMVSIKKLVKK
jgi:hypothetical protein